MEKEEKQTKRIIWWIVGVVLYIAGFSILFYILNFSVNIYLIFFGSSIILSIVIVLFIKSVKKINKKEVKKDDIEEHDVYKDIAKNYMIKEAHVALGEEIFESGISFEGEEKVPVYTIHFTKAQSADTYAICVNVKNTNVKKYIRNPEKEQVKELKQSVAGTMHETAITTETFTDPISGREVTKKREEPLYLLPKKEEKKEESSEELT